MASFSSGIIFQQRIFIAKIKAMKDMGHITKFLLIFRNNSRANERRYRFEMGN